MITITFQSSIELWLDQLMVKTESQTVGQTVWLSALHKEKERKRMKEAHLRSLLSFLQEDKVPNAWERAPKQMWREEWVNEQRNELMEHGIYSWTWRTRSLQVFFLAIKHEITTIHLLGAGAKPWRGGNLVTTQRNCKIGPWIYKLLLKTDFLPRCDARVSRRHRQ